MAQVITRDNRVMMITTVDYPAAIVKDMKKAGYKVIEIAEQEISEWENGVPKKTRRKIDKKS